MVDRQLAIQLINASGLAYSHGSSEIIASQYFAESKLVNNSKLKQITLGFDSVLIGQTANGVLVSFRGTLSNEKTDPITDIAADWFNDANFKLTAVPYSDGTVHRGFSESLDIL